MVQSKKFVPVVAVLNMKGGVGKTTISAHVFRVLFERSRAGVLLIDLDPQFNLTQALFKRAQYDEIKRQKHTMMSVMEPPSDLGLFDIKESALPPPDPQTLRRRFLYFPGSNPVIELGIIVGDFDLVKYSWMDDNKKLMSVRNRFLRFIEHAKMQYDIICIDCNPSSSFLTLCALHACGTHILVPVKPDRYSLLGLEILSEFLERVPITPKPQIVVVLNGIPRRGGGQDVADIEAELRAHPDFGSRILAGVIHDSGLLRARTDYTGFATDRRVAWKNTLRTEIAGIADEIAKRLGL
jgi:chromosome partitioning protein